MARGLSGLQRAILAIAAEKEDGVALYPEILHRYYGWEPVRRYGTGYSPCGWHFSKEAIGEAEYARTRATLSRSVTRLSQRGLVNFRIHMLTGKTAGISLTEKGRVEAENR